MADLTAAEADWYIRAHLAQVGRTDTLFSDDAVRVIHRRARGAHQTALRHRTARRLHREQDHRRRAGRRTAIAEETINATD